MINTLAEERRFAQSPQESIHIIKEYGIEAWRDIAGLREPMKDRLEELLSSLESLEEYEECKYLKGILNNF